MDVTSNRARVITTTVLLLIAAASIAGCRRAFPSPGPVPLRDAEHMSRYLVGTEAWELRGADGVQLFWSFSADGTCAAWILPGEGTPPLAEVVGLPVIPIEATRITASWTATEDRLRLTGIRTETGDAVDDAEIALRWLDGKLRIGIGEHQYMRRMRSRGDGG